MWQCVLFNFNKAQPCTACSGCNSLWCAFCVVGLREIHCVVLSSVLCCVLQCPVTTYWCCVFSALYVGWGDVQCVFWCGPRCNWFCCTIYFVECYAASVMPDQTGIASVLSVMTHWFRPRLAQCVVGWAPVLSIASVLLGPGIVVTLGTIVMLGPGSN